jgi:ribosomal protein L7/L12
MTVPNRRGVSYEEFRNIAAYLSIGKRIDAIKYLRTVTGCGLKDAKDTVEGWTY